MSGLGQDICGTLPITLGKKSHLRLPLLAGEGDERGHEDEAPLFFEISFESVKSIFSAGYHLFKNC